MVEIRGFAVQMKIAIFYHAILSGGTIPIDTHCACQIMEEQMHALDESGLLDEADEFHIGINGDDDDANTARLFVPCPDAQFHVHGKSATTEIPTMNILRAWLPSHPGWHVLYHHIKGVTQPHNPLYHAWRRCMEKAVVWDWRTCIAELNRGADSCGSHWLTSQRFPGMVATPFWGGTFWWTTEKFLSTLPPLPSATWGNRHEAENWIGRGPRLPRVRDYHKGWPSMACAGNA